MNQAFNITGSKFDFEVKPNNDEWYIKPFSIKAVDGVIFLIKEGFEKGKGMRIYKGDFIHTVFNLFGTKEEAEKFKYSFTEMAAAINANPTCVRQLYLNAFWDQKSKNN